MPSSSSPKKDNFQARSSRWAGQISSAVAANPERAALKGLIVAAVLLGNQIGHDLALVVFARLVRSWVIAV